ncbi:MAG: YidC/Oxa1 family insertase periplasmic-domain containing protein [Candidatus Omnitrophica bacterium]|nr:YidC/Oxa1 family insertase periplasmic-domain containing protein [Candidatus Omnitrophota bacterium]
MDIIFSESNAAIREVIFKDYQNYKFSLKRGFFLEEENLNFHKDKANFNVQSVAFVAEKNNKKISKVFNFKSDKYLVELKVIVQEMSNLKQEMSNLKLDINLPLVLGRLDFAGDAQQARFKDVMISTQGKVTHPHPRKEMEFPPAKFLGLRERYFCTLMEAEKNEYPAFLRKIAPQETEIGFNMQARLEPGQIWEEKFLIYLGPQDLQLLSQGKSDWQAIMYYGTFDFIAQLLLQLLHFLYKIVRNWGAVVVVLSFLIYLLLFPLTLKQMRSMKEMQTLQPKIEELRKLYKDNPQRLNKEIMQLYREHKVNPFGGCLPLILQIPIFFALYQVLMRSVSLKGANFLWIKDLSGPDRLFTLPFSLPVLGNEINLLPILMTIGMFIQQKISMAASGSASNEQQKMMLILFPLMFGFIFYHMPAGLVLYWFINSTLMLVYQFRVSRGK